MSDAFSNGAAASTSAAESAAAAVCASAAEAASIAIRIFWDGQRFLVWNTRQAYHLRGAHRIVGSAVGALPTNKRQTQEMGLPLSLLIEEVLLVAEEGIAEIVDGSKLTPKELIAASSDAAAAPAQPRAAQPFPTSGWFPIDAECADWTQRSLPRLEPHQLRLAAGNRLLHAQVFRALWSRGFFITSGSGFGADYLCYPGDPMRHHAHLLIHVARPGRPLEGIELSCAARLANSVKKSAVLAEAAADGEVLFSTVEQKALRLGPPTDLRPSPGERKSVGGGAQAAALAAAQAAAQAAAHSAHTAPQQSDEKAGDAREASSATDAAQAASKKAKLDEAAVGTAAMEVEGTDDDEEEHAGHEPKGGGEARGGGGGRGGGEATSESAAVPAAVSVADQVLRAPVDHEPALPQAERRARRVKAPWEEGGGRDDSTGRRR